jgi:N-acyl-D-aspartate/D-glutamate deacylase
MGYDLVIRNGRIVDGSGMPAFTGDVAVKDGKIAGIGKFTDAADRVIDADGLAVSPGFIDNHTHYDAQVLWDPMFTSSCWHGVTSIVMGNCGLALAPARRNEGDALLRMLSRIEAIPIEALRSGVDFSWESIGDYLGRIGRKLGLNVGSLIGHNAVRQYVMGDGASDRAATPDEIEEMREIVRQGMRAGALGFTTDKNPNHLNDAGRPIPSVAAPEEEFLSICEVLGELGAGVIQTSAGGGKHVPANYEMSKKAAQRSGRPVVWLTISHRWSQPDVWRKYLDMTEQGFKDGFQAYPICTPRRNNTRFTMKNAQIFDGLPSWLPIMLKDDAAKMAAFADPAMRKALHQEAVVATDPTTFSRRWDLMYITKPALAKNYDLKGKSVAELAQATGKDVLDAFLDLVVDEKLETGFEINQTNGDEEAVGQILRSPYTVIGLSDAGAHVVFDAGYGYCTRLLGFWVREKKIMSLEDAVRKLTFHSASVFGLNDRGLLRPGMAADITVFDPDTVDALEPEVVNDLPGGGPRLMQKSRGIHYTVVNGTVLMEKNEHTGAYPGQLLRTSAYRPA